MQLGAAQKVVAALFCLSIQAEAAQFTVSLSLDPARPGTSLSSNFCGLSYETALVLRGRQGGYFFDAGNTPLVRMFQTLRIRCLRIGGNTAERESVPVPTPEDIDHLFAFAAVAGVNVIYTLPLYRGNPAEDAALAKYVLEHYRARLLCFCLGNEPDKNHDFSDYQDTFRRYLSFITANTNVPEAVFCGPSATHGHPSWAAQFANAFGNDKRVVLVTQHEYPARSGLHISGIAEAGERLLSPNLYKTYEALYGQFVPAAQAQSLAYRLEEANSFSNGGAPGVSDAFAAALWGIDYIYWWAAHGAQGVNFHTGGTPPGDPPHKPMKYAVFWNQEDGLSPRPLAYSLKTFALAADGRLTPITFDANADHLNLAAYAVVAPDKTLSTILINKEHGSAGRDANIILKVTDSFAQARCMRLEVPGGDIATGTGITLGNAAIQNDGSWHGTWSPLPCQSTNRLQFELPAASACVVQLLPK